MKNKAGNTNGLDRRGMRFLLCLLVLISGLNGSCREIIEPTGGALEVNFEQLQGLWFDIAHLPNGLQEDCRNTTLLNYAEKNKAMPFVYECFRDGWWEGYPGYFTKNSDHPGLMQIHFDGVPDGHWMSSSHWLLAADPDGAWIVLGEPEEPALWIYTRTSRIEPPQLETIMQTLGQRGDFSERDLNEELIFTRH